jgi:glycosyltransferase involved in cell wall biosynthesis
MASHPPLVTIVIPTYNQADFLREALHSVINQDLADWQAVVVNNHSTDHTKDVVAEIAADIYMKMISEFDPRSLVFLGHGDAGL